MSQWPSVLIADYVPLLMLHQHVPLYMLQAPGMGVTWNAPESSSSV